MVNTINATAAVSQAQTNQTPLPTEKQLGGEMFLELEAIKDTLAVFDTTLVAQEILKKNPGMSQEEAHQEAEDFTYKLASNNYFPSILSEAVNELSNTLYVFKLGLQSGQYQLGDKGTDQLVELSYAIKLVLGNFTGKFSVNNSAPMIVNIFEAANNGQMSQFLESVVYSYPGEMDSVLFVLNTITNQMKSLLGLSSSKSAPHKEIDAAAKPAPLFDAGAKGAGIDAGAKLAALIDAGPMIDAVAMSSSLIDV